MIGILFNALNTAICYILSVILSLLMLIPSFEGNYIAFCKSLLKTDVSFGSISEQELEVTDEEKEYCRKWYNENVLDPIGNGNLPAYNFKYGLTSLRADIRNWTFSTGKESEVGSVYRGGKTATSVLNNEKQKLEVKVISTIYEEYASCEWTVYIKNIGSKNSRTISDFNALDATLPTGKTELYLSRGSDFSEYDFQPLKTKCSVLEMSFAGKLGRSSDEYMPYFNFCGSDLSAVVSIGWTGQWEMTEAKLGKGVNVEVRQENLSAYLTPDEEIRSPLVNIDFYKNSNPLKGYNRFRSLVTDCVYPEWADKPYTMYCIADPYLRSSADEIIEYVDSHMDELEGKIDAFWMDAGWYKTKGDWGDTLGTWVPDSSRYPDGILPLANYAKQHGFDQLLWYSPENITQDTELYFVGCEHPTWMLRGTERVQRYLWNYADDEAIEYMINLLSTSMIENGVTFYRQDLVDDIWYNWKWGDENLYDARTGICENHYVTNYYKLLDTLAERIDGFKMDICASGGKRLDLEMTRRSIPFWRTDYNNVAPEDKLIEPLQSQTQWLSMWLPFSGTCAYLQNEYTLRSCIMSLYIFGYGGEKYADAYYEQRELMIDSNIFPLAVADGSFDKMLATQFDKGDEGGMALIYQRKNVTDYNFIVRFNGLDKAKRYELFDYDEPEKKYVFTGEEMMTNGFELKLHDSEKAFILMYKPI